MRIVRAAEHVTVPWKNGGGTAKNIVTSPDGAGFDAFDWRLGGAHVGREGPFSLFPDVDRTMLILSPGTIIIHGLPGGEQRLTRESAPFQFPGDVQVSSTVPHGPIDNLNVMWDRTRFRCDVRRAKLVDGETIHAKGTLLVYCEGGSIAVGHERLEAGDTLATRETVALIGGQAILADILPL